MTEAAFIYDAIRTPRSKGKADGSLNRSETHPTSNDIAERNAATA